MELFAFALDRAGRQPFSGAEALRIATLQSARAMGVEDRFGSIQTGKTADLVVLDGDPLQDYRLIGKPVQALFMDGKLQVNHCGLELTSTASLTGAA
jgi:imidazolonepropionase-like amidohydrolase